MQFEVYFIKFYSHKYFQPYGRTSVKRILAWNLFSWFRKLLNFLLLSAIIVKTVTVDVSLYNIRTNSHIHSNCGRFCHYFRSELFRHNLTVQL